MSTSMTLRIDPLTLANVADGALEEQFQALLADVSACFELGHDGEHNIPWKLTHGRATCKVSLDIEFTHSFENGMSVVAVGSKLKLPARKTVARTVMIRDGAVFCEPGGEQTDLVTYINEEETGQ